MYIAPKSNINVNGITLTGYKLESGSWVISISQVAKVLNIPKQKVSDMIHSKWLELALGKAPKGSDVKATSRGGTQTIVAIYTDVFNQILLHEYAGGNSVALKLVPSLMGQALDIRFEGTLTPDLSYREVEDKALSIQEARAMQISLSAHNYFQNWMVAKRFSLAVTHDYLTTCLVGRTAKESRLLPQTCVGQEVVGVNHWQDTEALEMDTLTQVKLYCATNFTKSRKGYTYKDYIDQAVSALTRPC